jgi:hypothetical protein
MRSTGSEPILLSRLTGALFFVMAAGGIFGAMVVRQRMLVPGNAAATAHNILASETLFRAGVLGDLTAFVCDVAVAILLYVLLRRTSPTLALLSSAFRLVYTAAVGANLVRHLDALLMLKGLGRSSAFTPGQVQALAQQALESHQAGYSIVLVFFAVHLVLLAVLLVTADAFPGWLGILMLVAGAAYLVDGATLVLAPELRTTLNPYLTVPMSFELVLAGWMLVRGVRPTRWCGDRAVDGLPLFYRKEAS